MDFEATRVSLLERVGGRLLAPDGAVVSLRELAAAADVSTATLLEDRESLITAYLEHCYRQGTARHRRAGRGAGRRPGPLTCPTAQVTVR